MHDATFPHPPTRGNGAALILLPSSVVVAALSWVSLVTPGALVGVPLVAMLLAVAGVVVGVIVSEVSR